METFKGNIISSRPNMYVCMSVLDFLENRGKMEPTKRWRLSEAYRFNGFAFVAFYTGLSFCIEDNPRSYHLADTSRSFQVNLDPIDSLSIDDSAQLEHAKRMRLLRKDQILLHNPIVLYNTRDESSYLVDYMTENMIVVDDDDQRPPSTLRFA